MQKRTIFHRTGRHRDGPEGKGPVSQQIQPPGARFIYETVPGALFPDLRAAFPLDFVGSAVVGLQHRRPPIARERMRLAAVRVLVLVCSFLLVLPPGWCCLFQLPVLQGATVSPAPPVRSCCGHCQTTARTPASTPRPERLPPGKCPCTDRVSVLPGAPRLVACDLLPTVLLTLPDLLPTCDSTPVAVGLSVVHPPGPLHLCRCCWLC
jgi:hypothetical protein